MKNLDSKKSLKNNFKKKVAIIIPCFKVRNDLDLLIQNIERNLLLINENFSYKIILVDDGCPFQSYKKIKESPKVLVLHNKVNLGVGAATINGIRYALKSEFDFLIKLDADGQHPPKYLKQLIPYIFKLPKYKLFLTKGNRYKFKMYKSYIPILRRLGTLFLDPMARAALCYRGLSDTTNGFIAMDSITAKILISTKYGNKLEERYLFESSLLAKCSQVGVTLNEFCMMPIYTKDWYSSMNSLKMIFPLFFFWTKTAFLRIFNEYFLKFNLGSILIVISFSTFSVSQLLLFKKVLPEIYKGVYVTAGNSSGFTSSALLGIISFVLFLFYDYFSGTKTNLIFFKSILDEN